MAQLPARLPQFPQGGGRPMGAGGGQTGAGGAIIDDSTKMIYGPKTTRFFFENDVLNNRKTLYTLDTAMDGAHQYNFVNRNQNLLIDLGNLGTALRPVFYETPAIGTQLGFSAYGLYGYQTPQIRYFDTRSPHTNMYYATGGRGQNILNFDFTQNITPRWNMGFDIQRFTSDLQFGENRQSGRNNQRLGENWAFAIHSNYRTKNDKYTLLTHYNNLNHRTLEQGGQRIESASELYLYDGFALLNKASSREKRNTLHLYQQYVLKPGFQAYHVADLQAITYRFLDDTLRQTLRDRSFYRLLPTDRVSDSSFINQRTRYYAIDNQFGIKGTFTLTRASGKSSSFNYRAWYRPRYVRLNGLYYENRFDSTIYRQTRLDNIIGGWIGYYFPDSLTRLTAEVEHLVGKDVRLVGRLESRWFTAGYESVFASPTLIQEQFASNLYRWNNDNFGLRGTQHAFGTLNLKLGRLTIQPGLDYYLLSNYVYFDVNARPRQENGAFSVIRTGLGAQFRLGKLSILGRGYYTLVSRDEVLRIPPLFVNGRVQYELLYAKKLYIQTGVELHYKSAYFADSFMPLTQQWHIQNDFEVPQYVIADAFVNLRINRVRLFAKLAHANQGWPAPGYFTAPNYLGMRRVFGFGVHWLLFD
mgnify:CR=1 FL=1